MGIDFGQARNTTAWHPEPSFRGTYGLLSSCIVTMALCVWTAIHVNVPELEREGTRRFLVPRQTWRKISFLVVGLFAPELISWAAFEQRREARALHSRMIGHLADGNDDGEAMMQNGEDGGLLRPRDREADVEAQQTATNDNKQKKRRHPWTMTHSHYAVMGGFAFQTQSARGDFSPSGWRRVTLTSNGILQLAEHFPELVPDISLGYINDKSKANALAKAIVILQASWFAAQCLSRMAMGMTISLLELNTLAHAICALFAYVMWWNKPFDVSEPTIIDGPGIDLVSASMCVSSGVGKKVRVFNCPPSVERYTVELDFLERQQASKATTPVEPDTASWGQNSSIPWPSPPNGFYRILQSPKPDGQMSSDDMVSTAAARDHPDQTIFRLYAGQTLFGFELSLWFIYRKNLGIVTESVTAQTTKLLPFVEIPPTHVLCFLLAAEASGKQSFPFSVSSRRSNFPSSSQSYIDISEKSILFSLLIASLAYGGLHLLAWSPPVKTNAEIVLWRVSAIGITIFPLAIASYTAFIDPGSVRKYLSDKWDGYSGWRKIVTRVARFAEMVMKAIHLIWVVLYALARIYLVVECFISVPRLPDSVFAAPAWAQYFPHFG
ncbi:hypothetical protein QBC43DRAFT_304649 [Cladorrhinum sp. PSN259]|nr:hypothetical protein QBC43DRAFT_304649 [Cladorrhinum sp. PSN259]